MVEVLPAFLAPHLNGRGFSDFYSYYIIITVVLQYIRKKYNLAGRIARL